MCLSYCVIYLLPFCVLYENMMTELCAVQFYMFNCHKIPGNVLRS